MSSQGFRFRWYVYVAAVPVCGVFLLSALVMPSRDAGPDTDEAFRAGYQVGKVLGGLMCPLVPLLMVTTLTYFISRRSTLALNISALITLLVLGGVGVLSLLGNLMRAGVFSTQGAP